MQGAIAAGLAMKVILTFETNELQDAKDSMVIVSDNDYKKEVPLRAYVPQPSLIFEPFINFGFIKVNKPSVETISFFNEGKAPAKVMTL